MNKFINKVIMGDCLEKLKELPDNSVDSIVTDPPYELGFMGKTWDNTGIANNVEMWKECLRVLKPGGHLLAFSGTRTYHRMASAIEDAGFEVRDMIEWVYGSGFPKSLNLAKSFEKEYNKNVKEVSDTGASSTEKTNHVVGVSGTEAQPWDNNEYGGGNAKCSFCHKWLISGNPCKCPKEKVQYKSEQAKQWEGWGTALKPAHEPICMARKPLSEKTVAENCLKWGTGGINVDESRVETTENITIHKGNKFGGIAGTTLETFKTDGQNLGRFPANLIHDNSEEVRECFPESKSTPFNAKKPNNPETSWKMVSQDYAPTGGYEDNGNASRFFKSIIYQAKASKSERNKGCEGLEEKQKAGAEFRPNHQEKANNGETGNPFGRWNKVVNNHPTVKPIALMEYLIKMVTKPGGIVLDPFAGSGSTLVAAKQNGYQYIGIEMTEEYIPIIEARLLGVENDLFKDIL